jgi:uncharacterized membrane protein YebE (DUF533 family)
MNPEDLVNGVVSSVLGGRRKRSGRALRYLTRDLTRGVGHVVRDTSRFATGMNRGSGGFFSRPSTLLGALGLAWGVFETLQNQNQTQTAPGSASGSTGATGEAGWVPTATPGTTAPAAGTVVDSGVPPIPNVSAPVPPPSPDALRMMRLAVSAAHADGPMNEQERAAILQQAQQAGIDAVFGPEMTQPRPLAEIVSGVSDPHERATLYVLAYTVLRADEQVTGAERIYLAQLANLLGLDPATVAKLETDTGQRIDALGDQGQLGG